MRRRGCRGGKGRRRQVCSVPVSLGPAALTLAVNGAAALCHGGEVASAALHQRGEWCCWWWCYWRWCIVTSFVLLHLIPVNGDT